MQILSIRGENIASLAQPFEVNLDEGPVAAAGLFAITGETGAGKSSLLDAMCLALYGNCPRLSGDGTRESIIDVDGQVLKSSDPRMVLRRGAISGYAEVTFLGGDGQTYTAGWSARRARGRFTGRLQGVERSLMRCSDEQMLETQVTQVNDKVISLTGLTYDEFRRTVLLAQGDFDAFLGAKTDERAAILEKVTGTQIYRDISRKVFDRNRQAEQVLEKLQTRLGEHRLMSQEDLEALEAQINETQEAQQIAQKALKAAEEGLQAYQAVDVAQGRVKHATERATGAQSALDQLKGDQDWLAEYDKAQNLRSEAGELKSATTDLASAGAAASETKAAYETQQKITETAQGKLKEALDAHEAAKKSFKELGPVWDEAASLDNRVTSAAQEHIEAVQTLRAREATAKSSNTALQSLEGDAKTLAGEINGYHQLLAKVPGHVDFLASWSILEDRIGARISLASQIAKESGEKAGHERAIARDTENLKAADSGIEEMAVAISDAQKAQDAIKEERSALQAADPAARLERLSQAVADLKALQQANNALRAADQGRASSQAHTAQAQRDITQGDADLKAAEKIMSAQGAAIEALRRPAEAADAAASREAQHLRQHLVDGAPCPVCRATEHPIMSDSEIAGFAAQLRQQIQDAQATSDKAKAEHAAADLRKTRAERIIEEETRALTRLDADIQTGTSAFEVARSALQDGPISDLVPEDPRVEETVISAIFEKVATWRMKLVGDRDRLGDLNGIYQRNAGAIEAAQTKSVGFSTTKREIEARTVETQDSIRALTQSCRAAEREIEVIDLRISPLLQPLNQSTAKFDAQGAQAFETLKKIHDRLATTTQSIATAQEKERDLTSTIAQAKAAHKRDEEARAEAERVEQRRGTSLSDLKAERAKLLDGEATSAHRTRHNTARIKAEETYTAAQQEQSTQVATLSSHKAAWTSAVALEEKAQTRLQKARTALQSQCDGIGLSYERVVELHGASPDSIAARRAGLKSAETEKANADGAVKALSEDLEGLLEKGLPETPKEELMSSKTKLDAELAGHGETLGRLSERKDADIAARKAFAGIEAEITAATSVRDTWAAINDAIGSARGDRFAQIAQAVTLALLVERANLHLDDLKPRYQLRVADQDLALHVLDRDMADDARPTRLLSGGERFLVSLSLALALSGMGSRGALAGTLFIDEGFGSLDADSLDVAIDALERLQAQGRTIGVISHVQAMKDRIPVQLEVVKTGGGASEVCLKVA